MYVTMSVACSAQEIDMVHEDPTTASLVLGTLSTIVYIGYI